MIYLGENDMPDDYKTKIHSIIKRCYYEISLITDISMPTFDAVIRKS